MNKLNFLILSSLSIVFVACKSPEDEKLEREYQFERSIDTMQMESFRIPDSINTSLIICSYFDPQFNIHSLLVYKNADKKSVDKIDYLVDSTATVDQLEILKANEFRSNRYQMDYVVEQNSVHRIQVRQGGQYTLQKSQEYNRTDRD